MEYTIFSAFGLTLLIIIVNVFAAGFAGLQIVTAREYAGYE